MRRKLIEFMKLKEKILKELGVEIPLFIKEDYEEIEKEWTDVECKEVVERIDLYADDTMCPWCLIHIVRFKKRYGTDTSIGTDCDNCNYGERHGICTIEADEGESTYGKIIEILNLNRKAPKRGLAYFMGRQLNDLMNAEGGLRGEE